MHERLVEIEHKCVLPMVGVLEMHVHWRQDLYLFVEGLHSDVEAGCRYLHQRGVFVFGPLDRARNVHFGFVDVLQLLFFAVV